MAKIAKISTVKVQTQYGEKDKYLVTIEQDGKQIQADSFVGKWNNNWVLGMEFEIKKEQWKSREYNGKTYWSIMAPPEARSGFANPQELAEIKTRLEAVELTVKMMDEFLPMLQTLKEQSSAKMAEKAQECVEEEIPIIGEGGGFDQPEEDGVKLSDVPF